jgi:hypothetical protein
MSSENSEQGQGVVETPPEQSVQEVQPQEALPVQEVQPVQEAQPVQEPQPVQEVQPVQEAQPVQPVQEIMSPPEPPGIVQITHYRDRKGRQVEVEVDQDTGAVAFFGIWVVHYTINYQNGAQSHREQIIRFAIESPVERDGGIIPMWERLSGVFNKYDDAKAAIEPDVIERIKREAAPILPAAGPLPKGMPTSAPGGGLLLPRGPRKPFRGG